jgi:hypothetical protein
MLWLTVALVLPEGEKTVVRGSHNSFSGEGILVEPAPFGWTRIAWNERFGRGNF